MVRSKGNWDEDDVRINKSRQFGSSNKARPRTKDRPDYSAAQTATIIEVDRGRVKCLVDTAITSRLISRHSLFAVFSIRSDLTSKLHSTSTTRDAIFLLQKSRKFVD